MTKAFLSGTRLFVGIQIVPQTTGVNTKRGIFKNVDAQYY